MQAIENELLLRQLRQCSMDPMASLALRLAPTESYSQSLLLAAGGVPTLPLRANLQLSTHNHNSENLRQLLLGTSPAANLRSQLAMLLMQQRANETEVSIREHYRSKSSSHPSIKKQLQVLGENLRGIDECYVDISHVVIPVEESTVKKRKQNKAGGVPKAFIDKLHAILNNESHSNIITFLPHGRAFIIHDSEAFASEVMPQYFKQNKWASFSRQLSLYGFRRVNAGPDTGAYYHELFLQGRPELAPFMKRVGIPSGRRDRRKDRSLLTQRTDPDFYRMPLLAKTVLAQC